jgi:uncharacterized iron-regulated membrane protein
MRVRPLVLAVHLAIGIVTAPVLIVAGTTGALLVLEDSLTDRLDRAISVVRPSGPPLPVSALVDEVRRSRPGARLVGVQLPRDATHATTITVSHDGSPDLLGVLVDPYTARVLGTDADRHTLFLRVRQLHRQLFIGQRGALIVTWAAVLLAVLAITGPIAWWPRRRTSVRWGLTGWRRTLDVHASLGACASAFLLLFAVTGAVVHWDPETQRLIGALTGSPAPHPQAIASSRSCDERSFVDPDRLLAAARVALPTARATSVQLPNPRSPLARVTLKFPEDRTPNGRSIVMVDPCDGRAAFVVSTRSAPLAYLFPRLWNRELHTGDILGWPTRVLAFLFALSLPVMAITGSIVWLARRRRAAARVKLVHAMEGG